MSTEENLEMMEKDQLKLFNCYDSKISVTGTNTSEIGI